MTASKTKALMQITDLEVSIGERKLISDLNLTFRGGESWALLGKNGAGKTTLLHTLARLRPWQGGGIELQGKPIDQLDRREVALSVGLLFQKGLSLVTSTVLESAMLGRYPHQHTWLRDDQEDVEIVKAALAEFKLLDLAERRIDTLSGGELQRLALARLLAQSPALFLLDEPSNHLDIAHQLTGLLALRSRVMQDQATMVMATHDINLASRICDRVLLLKEDGAYEAGTAAQVLTENNLASAYDCEIRRIDRDAGVFFTPAINNPT
jgi:iron complex transport system ATP-binding protein